MFVVDLTCTASFIHHKETQSFAEKANMFTMAAYTAVAGMPIWYRLSTHAVGLDADHAVSSTDFPSVTK